MAAVLLSTALAFGQKPEEAVIKAILERDSLFWHDYNTCNVDDMTRFFNDSVEFYHDQGGATIGFAPLASALKKNICGNDSVRIRREAVRESIRVYPMKNGQVIYGAIISGEHKFYRKEGRGAEEQSGVARFTHLWILQGSSWKMTRILSYDHQPVSQSNPRKEISLSREALTEYEGKYQGTQSGQVTLSVTNGLLHLNAGGKDFELFAENKDIFFSKERDLVFEFVRGTNGKPERLLVKEHGTLAEELARIK